MTSLSSLVDSHCHLDLLSDYDQIENIVNRARDNDVICMQTISTSIENYKHIRDISAKYDFVYASVGVHPSNVDEQVVSSDLLVRLAQDNKVIGLGETGLDYYYNNNHDQLKLQKLSFEHHIEASIKNNLPVIIHSRSAEEDTLSIVKRYKQECEFPALIHCFTGSYNFGKSALDLGLYISLSDIVTFKNASNLHDIIKKFPIDRLLIETDSPYLAPMPNRGKTNEPSYVKYDAMKLADIMNVPYALIAEKTTNNFFQLFKKASYEYR